MKKNILKLFTTFIIIIVISILLIIFLNKKVVPIYMNYSSSSIKMLATTVINKTVSEISVNGNKSQFLKRRLPIAVFVKFTHYKKIFYIRN